MRNQILLDFALISDTMDKLSDKTNEFFECLDCIKDAMDSVVGKSWSGDAANEFQQGYILMRAKVDSALRQVQMSFSELKNRSNAFNVSSKQIANQIHGIFHE